ncbi:MAG: triose-phosphate isomerase [Deltaproteobacteria bacterium]|nr:triose-phosphate isomerase [Deltaproteobacteria bacterium]MBW1932438.1 triose-phosphate isomerase [Deltaproteobacteria bacterium]MBW1937781.1 triose-phosphate isomerase [Deltaproteobacteria bacterium]MBW1963916.1 triose-phosphate isomerase [Deltaproteobacteria bacterium]MBW2080458.1 triose-phosphate isomerase [Deltaproteobacteria bacterium]
MNSLKRRPILAANWKMYKTVAETRDFLNVFLPLVDTLSEREVIIAPPFTTLSAASEIIKKSELVTLAAQNMYFEQKGGFTGEISSIMLKEFGVKWVILGHSERRHIFGEKNSLIALKVKSAMENDLLPILCIGEKLEEREAGLMHEILEKQLSAGFSEVGSEEAGKVVIAYEPVWAIGTGKTATPDQAQDAHIHIRSWLTGRFDSGIAGQIRILYGGSVKPENVNELMALPDVDGALVGGASLKPENFSQIVSCRIS